MTYNEIINLLEFEHRRNELGVTVDPLITKAPVYCSKKSASSNTWSAARQEGKRPAYVFTIRRFEYSGQTQVEYNGRTYEVERTYEVGHDELELHVGEVIGL